MWQYPEPQTAVAIIMGAPAPSLQEPLLKVSAKVLPKSKILTNKKIMGNVLALIPSIYLNRFSTLFRGCASRVVIYFIFCNLGSGQSADLSFHLGLQ